MRVDARVQAKLALLPPQATGSGESAKAALPFLKERVQAVAAALEGRLDEEESEEETDVMTRYTRDQAVASCVSSKLPGRPCGRRRSRDWWWPH